MSLKLQQCVVEWLRRKPVSRLPPSAEDENAEEEEAEKDAESRRRRLNGEWTLDTFTTEIMRTDVKTDGLDTTYADYAAKPSMTVGAERTAYIRRLRHSPEATVPKKSKTSLTRKYHRLEGMVLEPAAGVPKE